MSLQADVWDLLNTVRSEQSILSCGLLSQSRVINQNRLSGRSLKKVKIRWLLSLAITLAELGDNVELCEVSSDYQRNCPQEWKEAISGRHSLLRLMDQSFLWIVTSWVPGTDCFPPYGHLRGLLKFKKIIHLEPSSSKKPKNPPVLWGRSPFELSISLPAVQNDYCNSCSLCVLLRRRTLLCRWKMTIRGSSMSAVWMRWVFLLSWHFGDQPYHVAVFLHSDMGGTQKF